MATANITVTVDTNNDTYDFVTNPAVDANLGVLPIDIGDGFTIKSDGANTNITMGVAIAPHATVTTAFSPTMAVVTTTAASYAMVAIGKVALTVPSYGGRPLSGKALWVATKFPLEIQVGGQTAGPVSFGAVIWLTVQGATGSTTVTIPAGLFVGYPGTTCVVAAAGTAFVIADVNDGAYELGAAGASEKMVPMVGTINVSSTKKPHA